MASSNSLNSEFGSEGAIYPPISAPVASSVSIQLKAARDVMAARTLAEINQGGGIRSITRGPTTDHQPSVSYHTSVPHGHHEPHDSAYNPSTIPPSSTSFNLPGLPNTSVSTAVPLLPPPFPPHLEAQRPSLQHQSLFQSDLLPSLVERLPSPFIQPSTLRPMSNPHSLTSSFSSSPFASSQTAQLYQPAQPDTRNQSTSSSGLNPSFLGDGHRYVSIDVEMTGSRSSFDDAANPGEVGLWNPDRPVRPLSPRDDVSQVRVGDATYARRGGQLGGGVRSDNYQFGEYQPSGPPPLDATEAIAKAMAAQCGDFGGGYKILPPSPTLDLPNLTLQSRQEESAMAASSRDNFASCAVPPAASRPSSSRAQQPRLSLRSPHSPDADSGIGAMTNTLVPPRLPLEGRASKETEMKRTLRVCLPRKEVCDHLVGYYVRLLHSNPCPID
jgi:hypothetical protein